MRITIVTVGSRGDVQPYVALSRGLQAAGHHVRLATHTPFAALARSYGLDYAPLEGNPRAVLESEVGQTWQASGNNPLHFSRHLRAVAQPLIHQMTEDCLRACQDADLVVYSVLGFYPVAVIADALRVPLVAAYLQPVTPTGAFAATRFPPAPRLPRPLRRGYNRLSHTLMRELLWQVLRAPMNDARQSVLGLPPLPYRAPHGTQQRAGRLHLYGYSRHVVPRPRDWAASNHVTGYWFLDRPADWQPPADLQAFLAAGPPPVYVGFGSMNDRNAAETTRLVIAALQEAGQQGVLLIGWGGLGADDLPETMIEVAEVPHDWLFPQMAAVVHHGGAGTTGAAARAGVPQVIVPFFGDQPFWARRAVALGIAPPPLPHPTLTVEGLAAALTAAVREQGMQQRAAVLGARIGAEDGVRQGVELIEQYRRAIATPARMGYNPRNIRVRQAVRHAHHD